MSFVDPVSRIFLHLERPDQPMHVGSLQIFSLPRQASADYVQQRVATCRADNRVEPPFDQCIRYRLGQPCWRTDPAFDVTRHVHYRPLPPPASLHTLFEFVADLHGSPLCRDHPLWEVYFIEGLARHRFAIYTRFHHALMDGASAMQTIRRCLSAQPDPSHFQRPWCLAPRNRPDNHASGHRPETGNQLGSLFSLIPATLKSLQQTRQDARREPAYVGPENAPPSMFNVPITRARQYAGTCFLLSRIRRLADGFGVTINDVALASCASALRRYLTDFNALPEQSLTALVPVSLRRDADETTGNRIGLIHASLATDIAAPAARLQAIKRSMNYWKHRYRAMSPAQAMAFTAALSMPAGLNFLTRFRPRQQAFNVVISNIPGPDQALYFGDARLLDIYPISAVAEGQALNISLVSYCDHVTFGLTACRQALPDIQRIPVYIENALCELEACLPLQAP